MTEKTDKHSEFDSRSPEAIPVQEVASPIESTPPVFPQRLRLNSQTEHSQAEEMKEAELLKKVLDFEESKRDFQSKMMSKSMERDAAMARADQAFVLLHYM